MNKPASVDHPSPHRHLVSRWQHIIGLFGAPAAWLAQMSLSEILTSNSCNSDALHTPAFLRDHLHGWLTAVGVGAFMIGLVSGGIAWSGWRRVRAERHGGAKHALDVGEGRARFLILLAAMDSALFLVAIIFTAFAVLLVEPCAR